MASNLQWKASESRGLPPFALADDELSKLGARIFLAEDHLYDDPWQYELTYNELSDPRFQVDFDIGFETEDVAAAAGLDAEHLGFSLRVIDPALMKQKTIFDCALKDKKKNYTVSKADLRGFVGRRGFRFLFEVFLRHDVSSSTGTASEAGERIAKREFSLVVPSKGHEFPQLIYSPDDFESAGYPRETVWALRWKSAEYNSPPEEVLCLLLNETFATRLSGFSPTYSVGIGLQKLLASELYAEVAVKVLEQEAGEPENETGLHFLIVERMKQATGLNLPDIHEKIKGRGISYARAVLQADMQILKNFGG